MRRLSALALAALLLVPAAPLQGATRGTIEGRVIDQTSGEPARRARVTLVSGTPEGTDRKRVTVVTGADGRFRFTGLETGENRIYALDVTYRGGTYAGEALSLPDDTAEPPVIETTVRVFDTTTDPSAVLVRRDNLFVVEAEGGVGVIESLLVINTSERAYIGRRGSDGPLTLGLALPAAARPQGVAVIDSSLNVPALVATDFGVGVTVAIPPGETRLTYSYKVPGSAGLHELSRSALYGTVELNVHAGEGIELRSNRLVPNGEVTIGGTTYERYSAPEGLDPGDQVQLVAELRRSSSAGRAAAYLLGGVALLAASFAAVLLLRRRRRAARAAPAPEPDRRSLLVAIAELDLRHRAGELSADDYARRRAELKARLEGSELEPAP